MNRIKALRGEHEMKQSDLANRLHVGQNTVSNWETGRTEPDSAILQQMSLIFDVSIDYILGHSTLRKSESTRSVSVPVLGEVAAGLPMMAEENIVDYEEIDPAMAATGELFGLRIKGSSMEPRIKEGDVVIVRKQEDVDTGDTAVVLVNGDSATVKRIKKETNGITLVPNNTAFSPIYYSNDDIERLPVKIIGKVLELRGKL